MYIGASTTCQHWHIQVGVGYGLPMLRSRLLLYPIPIIRIHKTRQDNSYQAADDVALNCEVGHHSARGTERLNMSPQSTSMFSLYVPART